MISTLMTAVVAAITAPGATPQAQAARPASDPDQVVCRTIKITGSRLGRQRVCMTTAQWDEERRQTRQGIERLQVRGHQERQ